MSMSKLRSAVGVCVVAGLLALGGALALSMTGPKAVAAAPRPASRSLTLREAVVRTLRHAGFLVAESGRGPRVSYGAAVGFGFDPKQVRPTPLDAERVAAQALLNAEVAYWNLYGARRKLGAREQLVQQAREAFDTCEARRKTGRVTEADLHQARGQYTLARAQRSQAEEQVVEDERQLRAIMGLPLQADTPLVPTDTPSVAAVQPDWGASVKEALAARAELKMARNNARLSQTLFMAEQLVRAVFHVPLKELPPYPPSFGRGTGDPLFPPSDPRGRLARDVEILKDQELKVVSYMANYYRRLSLNHEQFRAYRAQREAFEEQLQARQKEFVAGRCTLDILLEAQRFRAEALAQEHQSIAQFNNALAGFDFAKGAALKRHKVTLNPGVLGGS